MPRINRNKSPQKKATIQNLSCSMCGETKKSSEYYLSFNPLHSTGRLPYCKKCLKDMCMSSNGEVDLEKFKQMLKHIDRPYLYDIVKVSFEDKLDTVGVYMKNIAMSQYKSLGWSNSIFEPFHENENNTNRSDFVLTDYIIDKWGAGYKPEEYQAFERKYNFLKNNYPEKTAMHTEALLNYIRYRVKEELATATGDVREAKEWGSLAKDAATAAKINPSQLSKADLTEGLSTFGELVRAVEQAVDIIPILPKFKEKPQDKIDFTIWCYINYVRDLKGLPPCEYADIYKFYEERKLEYQKHTPKEEDVFENEDGEE